MSREPLQRSKPVIVTGTPFAGSSIVGEILTSTGVFLGDDFPLPKTNDFSGLACDREIAGLHDRMLAAAGTRWTECLTVEPLSVSDPDRAACEELLRRKFGSRKVWGWADPRTALFLDHWASLLPEATWVLVVRPPEASIWALQDRVAASEAGPGEPEIDGARLWAAYAMRIAAFAERRPDRTVLVSSPHDLFPANCTELANRLAAATGVEVAEESIAKIFDPLLIRVDAPPSVRARAHHDDVERAREMLTELGMRLAMEPRPPKLERFGDQGTRRVCMATIDRCTYSETFIRAQLNRMPVETLHLWGRFRRPKRNQEGLWIAAEEPTSDLGSSSQSTDEIRRSITRYLSEQQVAAVLVQFGPTSIDYIEPCRELDIPLFAHFHGFDAYKRALIDEFRTTYDKLFELAAGIVVVSTDMVRQLESLGAPRDKIHCIPCGVDPDRFEGGEPQNAPPTFLAVGRFVEKKGPLLTLLAFSKVVSQRPDARLVMIGEGPLLSPCVHLARGMGVETSVSFEGARVHSEVVRRMHTARAFVQHSVRPSDGNSEGTPVAVMEAGAAGLPVVASAHAGIADVVLHGETGFLVEEADVEAMTEHMISLVDDPALAARLGRQAQERIRGEFSLDDAIAKLWKMIRESISSTAGSRPGA